MSICACSISCLLAGAPVTSAAVQAGGHRRQSLACSMLAHLLVDNSHRVILVHHQCPTMDFAPPRSCLR
eukprot:4009062-Prorocentrum_lima.AAC.1